MCGQAWAQETTAEPAGAKLLKTDSRAPYLHRLTLYDAAGQAIDPSSESAPPYSPKMTCTKCHAYGEIACGWHFNSGSASAVGQHPGFPDETAAGRPGEPWILSDARLGVQIPISTRGWPGTFTPAQLGLTNWQFTLLFGRHLAGGGLSEPDAETLAASPEAKRWAISGSLEVDCMVCHATMASGYDPAELDRQVERQNFRWAPTAALGLGIIRGDARGVSDEFDPEMPPPPDRSDLVLPWVQYDRARFDGDSRVLFDIARRPPNERCYFCHSVRLIEPDEARVGEGSEDWAVPMDVHLASGLNCGDCHRNGIDHQITRGAPVSGSTPDSRRASLTCEGCHLGTASEAVSVHAASQPSLFAQEARAGGRYGAPHPQHAGIPPLHFERLACTTCHSGPWPGAYAVRVQTSLAHGLGVGSKERRDDAMPQIVEPVFGRYVDPKRTGRPNLILSETITPHRLLWPAYWGRQRVGEIEPLPTELVGKAAGRTLARVKGKPYEQPPGRLSDEHIAQVLTALKSKLGEGEQPVYVREGRRYSLNDAGALESVESEAAAALAWPLAHEVRPAAQALGAHGCTDCHDPDGAIFFGRAGVRPTAENPAPAPAMSEFHRYDPALAQAWAASFAAREVFKWIGMSVLAVITLVVLRYAVGGLGWLARAGGGAGAPTSDPPALAGGIGWGRAASLLLLLGVLAQTATSFAAEWLGSQVSGWTLLAHVALSPILLLGLVLVVFLRAEHNRLDRTSRHGLSVPQRLLFWIVLPLAILVVGTTFAAMLPLFGYATLRWLIEVHETCGLLLLIATGLHLLAALGGSKAEVERRK